MPSTTYGSQGNQWCEMRWDAMDFMASFSMLKGKIQHFSTWTPFSQITKGSFMDTILLNSFSKSTAPIICQKTGCNYSVKLPLKVFVFAADILYSTWHIMHIIFNIQYFLLYLLLDSVCLLLCPTKSHKSLVVEASKRGNVSLSE